MGLLARDVQLSHMMPFLKSSVVSDLRMIAPGSLLSYKNQRLPSQHPAAPACLFLPKLTYMLCLMPGGFLLPFGI